MRALQVAPHFALFRATDIGHVLHCIPASGRVAASILARFAGGTNVMFGTRFTTDSGVVDLGCSTGRLWLFGRGGYCNVFGLGDSYLSRLQLHR